MLKDPHVITKINALGHSLTTDLDNLPMRHMPSANPQALFKRFKDDVTSFTCQYAKKVIPQIDAEINLLQNTLNILHNDSPDELHECMFSTAVLEDHLASLETLRHMST